MVQDITQRGLSVPQVSAAHGVSAPTARKWLGRYLVDGEAGLGDASSRPNRSPRAIEPAKALAIVELRHKRLTQARIAAALGVSKSTVSRVFGRAGLSLLSNLDPVVPIVRYEHEAPGDILHIDTKKLGRIERPSHRVTGNRRDSVDGAGWEMLFVAIDDHARIAFTAMHADERTPGGSLFSRRAQAIPNLATKSAERKALQKKPWFRTAMKWRTGCEGRISLLKRRHGLNRCRYRGTAGMRRWVGLGVIADNLINIANAMANIPDQGRGGTSDFCTGK